jgi:conjugal transfer/entry exclusion protein
MKKRCVQTITAAAMAALFVSPAHAGLLVFDPINFIGNIAQVIELKKIRYSLVSQSAGTVNHYTKNIDNHTENIKVTNNRILQHNEWNYDIDASFTWIINNGDGEIIPIPTPIKEKMKEILGGGSAERYADNFKDAAYHLGKAATEEPKELFEGSRARKAANDLLVQQIETEQKVMEDEVRALEELHHRNKGLQGHGHQLQMANALSASQINQMMKLRSSMLVSEAQRAAEAQVAADRDARAIATSARMRAGLSEAIASSKPLRIAP